MTTKQKRQLAKILAAAVLFAVLLVLDNLELLPGGQWLHVLFYLLPYFLVGYDVLWRAIRAIPTGKFLDENFLMSIASIGAMATGEASEAVAVMLFYQVGELFQSVAVGRSRRSITALVDILPESATVERDGALVTVAPSTVTVGETILVRPGERIPLDGKVIGGASSLDTAALTGESLPREVTVGDSVLSGSVNREATLRIETTSPFESSAVSRVLAMVEESSSRKAKTENFISRFAQIYTPTVVAAALLIAVVPPLILGPTSGAVWRQFVHAAMIFLVISCPCALVLSIPMAFFGGIGGASSHGILVKGSNYLEQLANARTVVFDKTGTLTRGSFSLTDLNPAKGVSREDLLAAAAAAECRSTHPVAQSILRAYNKEVPAGAILSSENFPGRGVRTIFLKKGQSGEERTGVLYAGREDWLRSLGLLTNPAKNEATAVHVALSEGESLRYLGVLSAEDEPKEDTAVAIADLRAAGVRRLVMLTGDREEAARALAERLSIDEYRAGLLPQDKVAAVSALLEGQRAGAEFVQSGDSSNFGARESEPRAAELSSSGASESQAAQRDKFVQSGDATNLDQHIASAGRVDAPAQKNANLSPEARGASRAAEGAGTSACARDEDNTNLAKTSSGEGERGSTGGRAPRKGKRRGARRAAGTLVFVGDGINDAPSLSLADVGVAMGALGSDAAIEAADVVLADDKLSRVPLAIRIAKKTMRIARENIVLALAVKAAVMALDLLSAFSPLTFLAPYMAWLAVFADVGVAILAVLNALRAMRVKEKGKLSG